MSSLPPYIAITDDPTDILSETIEELQPDKVVCLVDENTRLHCLPKANLPFDRIIEIKSGEANKNLKTCELIWSSMTRAECSRKSLLVNLGGGVIGDMGGFCAVTYKRGMRFVNVPTTLLSQVDASIGGKLGVDFHGLKNHIGVFHQPDKVIVSSLFLDTLDGRELTSGYAEMIKHALIYDAAHWSTLSMAPFEALDYRSHIAHSIRIKNSIVMADPLESGLRKILNFGHTLGHAIESFYMESALPLLHGEAIAIGMILEAHLSWQSGMIKESDYEQIKNYIKSTFPHLPDSLPLFEDLEGSLHQDKKNEKGKVMYSLLQGIGKCCFNVEVARSSIQEALDAY